MASAIKKVNKISQVVSRWKSKTLRPTSTPLHSSPSDSDEPAAPNNRRRTPSGSVAVYVGSERRRFVIPTRFLNLPVFVALLGQAEEEFGYPATGALTLPCETDFFSEILRLLDENEEKFRGLGLDEFLQMGFDVDRSSVAPLLQKSSRL